MRHLKVLACAKCRLSPVSADMLYDCAHHSFAPQEAFAQRAAALNSSELEALRADRAALAAEARDERRERDAARAERLSLEREVGALSAQRDQLLSNIR